MSTQDFDVWFNELKEKENLQDIKFALGTGEVSVRELKDEFKRLHSMAKVPDLTLPIESNRDYEDNSLREIIAELNK